MASVKTQKKVQPPEGVPPTATEGKSLVSRSSGRRELDLAVASRRFREARAERRLSEVKAASLRFKEAQAAYRSAKGESKQATAGDRPNPRNSRSGLCMDVPVAPASPWSARDLKPSHVLGYDSPRAHSLGYFGDKGRVPSHRLRYQPK